MFRRLISQAGPLAGENWLRTLIDTAVDGIIIIDAEGRVQIYNAACEALFDYGADEVIGRNVKMLMPQPHRGEHDRYLGRYRETGQRKIIGVGREVLGRRKDGSHFPLHISVGESREDDDRYFVGILRDLTEQKRAEALNTRLGRIVENSANEIYVFDAGTLRFLQVNRGARENLGYSLEELCALTPLDLNPELTPEALENLLEPLRDGTREQVVFETVHRRKDRSRYDVEIRLQLMRAEVPQVFVAIIQDITELRTQQEQLRQAQKMDAVGQLTGGVAHDFNNLLTVITGSLELLEARVRQDDQRELIVQAQEAAELGAKLTGQLLAFARRQPLDPKAIDLNALVLAMSDWLPRTLGETIQIVTVPAEDLNKTLADPGQVENAVLNLAINARDAMPGGGTLTIKTVNTELDEDYTAGRADVSPGRYVVLSVTDTGCGIAPEIKDRVFEPFFTTKDAASGAGLGLSMVYGFAKQSGGHLALYSEPGCGTTVNLYLPQARTRIEAREAREAPEPAAAVPGTKGETVLVVEDNWRVRRITSKRLTDLGYVVLEAENGKAALEVFETGQSIDLLFTDILMPGGMTGGDLAREARHLRPGIRILFTSGYPSEAAVKRGLLDKGAELLSKPYSKTELIGSIRKALD
jgi:PAS domain S-box-containing protein